VKPVDRLIETINSTEDIPMTYRVQLTVLIAVVAVFANATAGQAKSKSKFRNGIVSVGLQQPKKQPTQHIDNVTFWELMARRS
jgi:hypothetical protein